MTCRTMLAIAALLVGACSGQPATDSEADVVRIVMGGDVMLGRGVGTIAERDPHGVFAGIEMQLAAADLAMANLESPLTERPAVAGIQYDLTASPAAATLLAEAGIDVVSVANNHAGDAGPATMFDTVAALTDVGVGAVGGGMDIDEAQSPATRTIGAITVGVLAFDATGVGPAAGRSTPGVAIWDDSTSPSLVSRLRERVDVLVVSIHGGAEYLVTTDASMRRIIESLAELDVDIVWGHGPHVVQETTVIDPDGNGRRTVAAASLGNLLFDQARIRTDRGALLEVIADRGGVKAYRLGETIITDGRVSFSSWILPDGPAALVGGEWWALMVEPRVSEATGVDVTGFSQGDVIHAAAGDVDLDGGAELVVSFRRPFRRAPLNELLDDVDWVDDAGRSAHVGVFETGWRPVWVASAVVRPVRQTAVCDGAVAVVYSTLDNETSTGAGGWTWTGFGWDEAPDLEGNRPIGCADVDGDGNRDPVVGSPSTDEP